MRQTPRFLWFWVALIALVFGVVGGLVGTRIAARALGGRSVGGGLVENVQPIKVETSSDAIVQAVKSTAPGVVKVIATTTTQSVNPLGIFGGQNPAPQQATALGTGFIFDHEGRKLILTNRHVVGAAPNPTVKLSDGRTLKAKVLGADPQNDLAVLELQNPPADLYALPLGNSDTAQVGQWVIAMGNPFDFEQTVTVGVISAKGFRRIGQDQPRNVIQTDAAINQGNSGGPLLDLGGNVIGINFAIYSPTETNLGIGFAIPINQAKALMFYLINGGPWVGLEDGLVTNSPGFARYFDLATDKGLVIMQLFQDSPVIKAGIQPGDIVLGADGQSVSDVDGLRKIILSHKIGEKIKFQLQRGSKVWEVSVTGGRVPPDYYLAVP